MEWAKVYITAGELEAEMIKGFLQAQGITVTLIQESVGRTLGLSAGMLGQVQVLVPEDQFDEARILLLEMESGFFEDSINTETDNDSESDQEFS
jgi:hypothetical protein